MERAPKPVYYKTPLRDKVSPEKKLFARQLRNNPTYTEQVLWEHLRSRRFCGMKFRRQSIIRGWIVDFYCPSQRLVVEIDGSSHDNRKKQDAQRDAVILSLGIKTIRVTNNDVINRLAHVMAFIKSNF